MYLVSCLLQTVWVFYSSILFIIHEQDSDDNLFSFTMYYCISFSSLGEEHCYSFWMVRSLALTWSPNKDSIYTNKNFSTI